MRTEGLAIRVRELSIALLRAMEEADVAGLDVLTSSVDFTPLAWGAPPIRPHDEIGGQLATIFGNTKLWDRPQIDVLPAYHNTLHALKYSPEDVTDADQVMRVGEVFEMGSETRLVFSSPNTADVTGDDAIIFALEYADVMASLDMGWLHSSNNDYYVDWGDYYVGIKDGKIGTRNGEWDEIDVDDQVPYYLGLPRGVSWETMTLNVLDRLTFWYEREGCFKEELAGFKELLTLLRYICTPGERAWLEQALIIPSARSRIPKEKAAVLTEAQKAGKLYAAQEALKLYNAQWNEAPALRVFNLLNALVPAVMTEKQFNSRVCNLNKRITKLSKAQEDRIHNALLTLNLNYGDKTK